MWYKMVKMLTLCEKKFNEWGVVEQQLGEKPPRTSTCS